MTNKASGSKIKDYVPEKSDGTLFGGTAWTQGRWPGKGAVKFDGKDDYVGMNRGSGRGSVLEITGTNLAVECWFKIDDPSAIWRGMCGNYHSGTGGYMLIYTGQLALYFGKTATGAVVSSENVSDGKWHHAVGVLDNGTMKLYVDGMGTSGKTGETVLTSAYFFAIGRYGDSNYFNGTIDEIAVYKRPLSADEIKNHYETGKPE